MKKLLLLISVTLLSISVANGQLVMNADHTVMLQQTLKPIAGFIVDLNGDTLRGEIMPRGQYKMSPETDPNSAESNYRNIVLGFQNQVQFKSPITDDYIEYSPTALKAFGIDTTIFVSFQLGLFAEDEQAINSNNQPTKVFVYRLQDGAKLQRYLYFKRISDDILPNDQHNVSATEFLYKVAEKQVFIPKFVGLRKKLATFVADCPVVAKQVEDKNFPLEDLALVVVGYNKHKVD